MKSWHNCITVLPELAYPRADLASKLALSKDLITKKKALCKNKVTDLGGSLRGTSANAGRSPDSKLDLSKCAGALSVCDLSKLSLPFLLIQVLQSLLFLFYLICWLEILHMSSSVAGMCIIKRFEIILEAC